MAPTTTESLLLLLPAELRNEIWRLVLVSAHPLTSYVLIHPIEEFDEETKAPVLVPGRSRVEAYPKLPPLLAVCRTVESEGYSIFWLKNTFAFNLGQAEYSKSDTIHTWYKCRAPSAINVNMTLHFVLGRGLQPHVPASLSITWKPSETHPRREYVSQFACEQPTDIMLMPGGDLANQCICIFRDQATQVAHNGWGVRAVAQRFEDLMPGLTASDYYPPTETCEKCGKPVVSDLEGEYA